MVAGTILVENVFAWPGLGAKIVSSILAKDYPMVQGIVLVYGVGVLLVNLVVDVLLGVLDPRSTIREALCAGFARSCARRSGCAR
jgi:peptide/nickel transport system permease protein